MGTPFKMKSSIAKLTSPMKDGKTRLIDKFKAGAKALRAGAGAVHGGFDTTVATYRQEKKKYRQAQKKKA